MPALHERSEGAKLEAWFEKALAKVELKFALLVIALILFFIAWNRGITLIYGLLAVVVVIVLLGWLLPLRSLTSIQITRSLPSSAREGELLRYTVSVENGSRWGYYYLQLEDWVPFAEDEQRRPFGFIAKLAKVAEFDFSIRCDLRGVHHIGPMSLSSGYPLGIYQHTNTLADSYSEIVVYPNTFDIEQLVFLDSNQSHYQGDRSVVAEGGHEIFMGLREYRRGDSPRNIHWRASARNNTLYTKVYESVDQDQVTILLDLNEARHCGEGKDHSLEYAIKIAASIARHLLSQGKTVSLLGRGKSALTLSNLKHINSLDRVLKALAYVEVKPASEAHVDDYQELIAATINTNPHQSLVLFDHSPENEFLDVHGLAPRQQKLLIRFNQTSFSHPLTNVTPKVASGKSCRVKRGDSLSRVFQG